MLSSVMSYNDSYTNGGRGGVYSSGPMNLPTGWHAAYTPTGDMYYIDHNTRTTHWQIPAEVMQQYQQQLPHEQSPQQRYGYDRNDAGYRSMRQRRGIDRNKVKTKMCMNIQNGGKCFWGERCAFAHSSEELSTHPHHNVDAHIMYSHNNNVRYPNNVNMNNNNNNNNYYAFARDGNNAPANANLSNASMHAVNNHASNMDDGNAPMVQFPNERARPKLQCGA